MFGVDISGWTTLSNLPNLANSFFFFYECRRDKSNEKTFHRLDQPAIVPRYLMETVNSSPCSKMETRWYHSWGIHHEVICACVTGLEVSEKNVLQGWEFLPVCNIMFMHHLKALVGKRLTKYLSNRKFELSFNHCWSISVTPYTPKRKVVEGKKHGHNQQSRFISVWERQNVEYWHNALLGSASRTASDDRYNAIGISSFQVATSLMSTMSPSWILTASMILPVWKMKL